MHRYLLGFDNDASVPFPFPMHNSQIPSVITSSVMITRPRALGFPPYAKSTHTPRRLANCKPGNAKIVPSYRCHASRRDGRTMMSNNERLAAYFRHTKSAHEVLSINGFGKSGSRWDLDDARFMSGCSQEALKLVMGNEHRRVIA